MAGSYSRHNSRNKEYDKGLKYNKKGWSSISFQFFLVVNFQHVLKNYNELKCVEMELHTVDYFIN